MGKMVSQPSLVAFDPILAGNEDMHKSRTSSNFGQIGQIEPLITELAALERLIKFP